MDFFVRLRTEITFASLSIIFLLINNTFILVQMVFAICLKGKSVRIRCCPATVNGESIQYATVITLWEGV